MKKDKNEMYEETIRKIITNKMFKIEFENILKLLSQKKMVNLYL